MLIRNKILSTVLLSTIPVILIGGYVNYQMISEEITQDVLDQLDSLASIQKQRVTESIDQNFDRLNGVTSRTQLRISLDQFNQNEDPNEATRILRILDDAKSSLSEIEDIFILNHNGDVILSTHSKFIGKNYLNDEIFEMGYKKNYLTITSYDEIPTLFLSGPLILDEKAIGVLVIKEFPDSIFHITSDYASLGTSGESFMAKRHENGDALFITSLRFDPNSILQSTIPKERTDVPITQALLMNEATFVDTVDYRNIPVLSATRYIEETDWGLAVKIDKEEAFSSIEVIKNSTIIVTLTVIGLVFIASFFLAYSFSSRIKKLSLLTNLIAQGKLDVKISASGNDEIGNLAKDISKMEVDLQKNQKELIEKERFSAIGELAARIAHDIRNPLSIISGDVGLMKMNQKNPSDSNLRAYDRIERAVERINHQIKDVLDYVKDIPLEKKHHLVNDILYESLEQVIVPKDVTINLPENNIKILGDFHKLSIVFTNLILNSIQAMENKGTIIIQAKESENEIFVTFQDSGPGFPPDFSEKLFEVLYTTKQEGTGLGLVTCKKIIEQHGGTISAQNDPTIFKIILPKN